MLDYIKNHGEGSWSTLPKAAGCLKNGSVGLERCGKSCRLRWMNYLRPDIKRGDFCLDEEGLIIKLHALLGNRWSLIAGRLPGRTDNEVKNYWNSHIKKKLIRAGIDPNNHRVDQKIPLSCENTAAKSSVSSMQKSSSNGGDEEASSSIQIAVRPRPLKMLQNKP